MKNTKTISIWLLLAALTASCTKDELPQPEKEKVEQEAPKTVDFKTDSTKHNNGEGA